jgi:glyoxylase-like metal-dependent hydrolase (beta-lactamase superfamily II)
MNGHSPRALTLFRGLNHRAGIGWFLAVPVLITGAWSSAGEKPSPARASIDFSSKHDILIRSEDGTLTPMDVPYFRSTLIAPGTWQILSDGDYTYLVEGDQEALAIDSGYGAGNIREYCQTLTKKPVRYIANTHDHFDHTANNSYFERAYMSAETKKKATIPFPSFEGISFPRDYSIEVIGDGYKFQLGNRELEVFEIPNHASGSLAFLDKRERILFSGDEIMAPGIRLNCSVAQLEKNLQKIAARRSEYDRLCAGSGILDASSVDKLLANARYILAGHEGAAVQPRSRPPAAPDAPSGPAIYGRRMPRPGDVPRNIGQANEYQRRMTFSGCDITYDIRRVRD